MHDLYDDKVGRGYLMALATRALSKDCMISTITVGNTNVATGTATVVNSVAAAKDGSDRGCRRTRWRISRDDSVTEKYRAWEGASSMSNGGIESNAKQRKSIRYVSNKYD